jgi:hypothetical protein
MNKDIKNISEVLYIGSHGKQKKCPQIKSSVQGTWLHTRLGFEGNPVPFIVPYLNNWPMQKKKKTMSSLTRLDNTIEKAKKKKAKHQSKIT